MKISTLTHIRTLRGAAFALVSRPVAIFARNVGCGGAVRSWCGCCFCCGVVAENAPKQVTI